METYHRLAPVTYDVYSKLEVKLNVVMTVYNGFRGDEDPVFLRKAIDSVLASIDDTCMLTIVENGSQDNSWQWLQVFSVNKNINLIHIPIPVGGSEAFDIGARAINSTYLTWCDCDDLLIPGYHFEAVKYLDLHPEIVFVGCKPRHIDDEGNSLPIEESPPSSHDHFKFDLFNGKCCNPGPVVRRDVFFAVGGFNIDNKFNYAADYDLYLRIVEKYRTAFLPMEGYAFRQKSVNRPSLSDNYDMHCRMAADCLTRSIFRRSV